MAIKPSLASALLYLSSLLSGCAAQPVIRDEIAALIPECASVCFRSFVHVNYGTTTCGRTPSLQCLCSRRGASSFTVGEGALQCISAERAIGFCSSDEASDAVINRAFAMCEGQDDAVEPTNGIITATLIFPPSGSGIITVPPVTNPIPVPTQTTTSTSTSARSSSSSSRIPSSSAPSALPSSAISSFTSSASTTLLTATQESSTSTESSSATPGAGEEEQDEANEDGTSDELGTGQIIGISIGVSAATAFAVLAIFLARYYRKRRYPGLKTGFFPRRDTFGYYSDKKPTNDSNPWLAQQITAPLEPFPAPPSNAYNRSSWRPSAIGLAISPPQYRERAESPIPPRRTSKLLPAKPTMALPTRTTPSPTSHASPTQAPPAPAQPSVQPFASPGQPSSQRPARPKLQIPQENPLTKPPPPRLILNERESTLTEFEEDGARSLTSPSGLVWKLPSAGPLSASTIYVSDKAGNWILKDPKTYSVTEAKEPPLMSPTAAATSEMKPAAAQARSLFARAAAGLEALPETATSRERSAQASLAPAAEITPTAGLPRGSSVYSQSSSVPQPLFSFQPNPTSSASAQRPGPTVLIARPRTESESSGATHITTSSEDCSSDPSPPAVEQQSNLSPVAESPYSGSGRSPVSYPKIPGRGRNGVPRESVAARAGPPPSSAFTYSPPGQPSPTLGLGLQQQASAASARLSVYNNSKGKSPMHNPGLVRNGSPTMRIVRPSPEPDDRTQLPSSRPRPPYQAYPGYLPDEQPPPQQRQPQPQQQSQQKPLPQVPHLETRNFPLPPLTVDYQSPASERTVSNTSSLLAKRLGSDRAANMAIPTNTADPRWRRDGLLSPEAMATPKHTGDLPATPTWMPRLTPTRRGDDLFLNVQ
ncbi:hypothetical protein S40288_07478 [Stachybotrys chartarum IBT 40288]|nr:hypothetical protein S40288_07478 [Stachybotrys chartarum IBT 40288]